MTKEANWAGGEGFRGPLVLGISSLVLLVQA